MSVSSNNPPTDVESVKIAPQDATVETIPPVDMNAILPNLVKLQIEG